MSDTWWKRGLRRVYSPPPPQGKAAFLERFSCRELSTTRLLLMQAAYLRPWSWLVAAGIFAAAWWLTHSQTVPEVWLVSALLPLAALSACTEFSRSVRYRMEELERTARFSWRTLLLARLTLLGLGDLLLLAALIPLVAGWSGLPLLWTGCALLSPYCLTALACLAISRRMRGREGSFVCASAALGVSGLCYVQRGTVLLDAQGDGGGLVWATLVLAGLTVWMFHKYLAHGEAWI